jgi:predicted dehydrogenase
MTQQAAPLRVAAIGAGGGSVAHFAAASRTGAIEIVGVLDTDADRARAQADRYGIPRCYSSLDELLADERAACVAVLTPPDTHEALTCAALSAGRHVVCEKPLGRTVPECDRMLGAAAAADRRLLPVHNRIYSHAVARARKLVRAGELGSVFLAASAGVESPATIEAAAWLRTDASLGGVIIAQATHPLYVLRWLFGDADSVSATAGPSTLAMSGEDTAALTVRFRSGAIASLIATFAAAPGSGEHAITLFGTTGTHKVSLPGSEGWSTGFERMWSDYSRAIRTGTPALVSAQDGREVVRIVRAAYQAITDRKTVKL